MEEWSLVLLVLDVVVLEVVLLDLHLLDHLGRGHALRLGGGAGGRGAEQGDCGEQQEEGDAGGFAEGDHEGHEEGRRAPEGDVHEDGQVAHLRGVALVEHHHHDEGDDGAADAVEEEQHHASRLAAALPLPLPRAAQVLDEPHADREDRRAGEEQVAADLALVLEEELLDGDACELREGVDEAVDVDVEVELVEEEAGRVVDEHHEELQRAEREEVHPQRLVPHQVHDREHASVLLPLVLVVLLLDLPHARQREPVLLRPVPRRDPQEGRVDLLGRAVGDELDGRILDHQEEADGGGEGGQDEDQQHHPAPVVDEVEGERVQEDAQREGEADHVVELHAVLLGEELGHEGEEAAVGDVQPGAVEEDTGHGCRLRGDEGHAQPGHAQQQARHHRAPAPQPLREEDRREEAEHRAEDDGGVEERDEGVALAAEVAELVGEAEAAVGGGRKGRAEVGGERADVLPAVPDVLRADELLLVEEVGIDEEAGRGLHAHDEDEGHQQHLVPPQRPHLLQHREVHTIAHHCLLHFALLLLHQLSGLIQLSQQSNHYGLQYMRHSSEDNTAGKTNYADLDTFHHVSLYALAGPISMSQGGGKGRQQKIFVSIIHFCHISQVCYFAVKYQSQARTVLKVLLLRKAEGGRPSSPSQLSSLGVSRCKVGQIYCPKQHRIRQLAFF